MLVGFFRDPDENTPTHLVHCARCAKADTDTRSHTTHGCDDHRAIEDDIFRTTNKVLKEAKGQHKEFPRLWLRGLIPRKLLSRRGHVLNFEAKFWITEKLTKYCTNVK